MAVRGLQSLPPGTHGSTKFAGMQHCLQYPGKTLLLTRSPSSSSRAATSSTVLWPIPLRRRILSSLATPRHFRAPPHFMKSSLFFVVGGFPSAKLLSMAIDTNNSSKAARCRPIVLQMFETVMQQHWVAGPPACERGAALAATADSDTRSWAVVFCITSLLFKNTVHTARLARAGCVGGLCYLHSSLFLIPRNSP